MNLVPRGLGYYHPMTSANLRGTSASPADLPLPIKLPNDGTGFAGFSLIKMDRAEPTGATQLPTALKPPSEGPITGYWNLLILDLAKRPVSHSAAQYLSDFLATPSKPTEQFVGWSTIARHRQYKWRDLQSFVADSLLSDPAAMPSHTTEQVSESGDRPFILLERAKELLSDQRVREAIDILSYGVSRYPEDAHIAQLLRAISPGRALKKAKTTEARDNEVSWIRRHGRDYRGKWVAVCGNELMASRDTLDGLLEDLRKPKAAERIPLIQYVGSE